MGFQRADFGLFRTLVERVPWETVTKGKGVQAGCTFFKEKVLKAQDQAVPHVLQVKPTGKTTVLAKQGALAGIQKKNEGLPTMEERAGNSTGVQGSS